MKQLLSILLLGTVLFSCKKDNDPVQQQKNKVVDKVEIKKTYTSSSTISNSRLDFEYSTNKEISKISLFDDDLLYYSYTYVYQNNIPTSSMYDYPSGGDPVYEIRHGYTNGRYSSYYDTHYADETVFSYDAPFNQYTNSITGNKFVLNDFNDITLRTGSGNEYAFSFDTSKKGPLYNVANKKWIPALWYGISGLGIIEISTHPVTSLFDDNIAQTNPYTNTYDTEGFVTKSVFSLNNGSVKYEITYIYISI